MSEHPQEWDWSEVSEWRARRRIPWHTGALDFYAHPDRVEIREADFSGGHSEGRLKIPRDQVERVIEVLQSLPEPPEWVR